MSTGNENLDTTKPPTAWYRSNGGHEVFRMQDWKDTESGSKFNALIMQGGRVLDHGLYSMAGSRLDHIDDAFNLNDRLPDHGPPPAGWDKLPSWGEVWPLPTAKDAEEILSLVKRDAQRCLHPGARYEIRDRGKGMAWYRVPAFDRDPAWGGDKPGDKGEYTLIGQFYAGAP